MEEISVSCDDLLLDFLEVFDIFNDEDVVVEEEEDDVDKEKDVSDSSIPNISPNSSLNSPTISSSKKPTCLDFLLPFKSLSWDFS